MRFRVRRKVDFAATGRTDQRGDVLLGNIQVDIVQSVERTVEEVQIQGLQFRFCGYFRLYAGGHRGWGGGFTHFCGFRRGCHSLSLLSPLSAMLPRDSTQREAILAIKTSTSSTRPAAQA